MARFGGIEAGGTKFVCVVGRGPDDIESRARIDTTTPDETLGRVVEFFSGHGELAAIGVASFGPLELRVGHARYGHITTTPKPGWADTDVVGPLSEAFGIPIGFDTDVNGAVLGEWMWGAGRGLDSVIYLTVGTGIGGGAIISGSIAHGLVHPEMGHVSVRRQPGDDYPGHCPFHGDCLEGMASGPALEDRWGRRGERLGELTDRAVEMEAGYLASGLRQFVYAIAPQRIVIGGGVSELPGLLARVRRRLLDEMGGYAVQPEHRGDGFVVPPGLGDDSGAAGAIALAMRAAGV